MCVSRACQNLVPLAKKLRSWDAVTFLMDKSLWRTLYIGGNGEFSTQKWIWVDMGNFLPKNPDMDGYGSGRTWWSGVGLRILPREGLYLNPRPAGGGQILPPLSNIRDNLRTTWDIATKLSVPYRTSIWHLVWKFCQIWSENFWENDVLVTSCHEILSKKWSSALSIVD